MASSTASAQNFGYLYLEDKKQYFSFMEKSYFTANSYHFKSTGNYAAINDPAVSVLGKNIGTFEAFDTWLQSSVLSAEDKMAVHKMFRPFKNKKYIVPIFNLTKKLVSLDTIKSSESDFNEFMKNNLDNLLLYQQNTKAFQKILKKYKLSFSELCFSLTYFDQSNYDFQNSRQHGTLDKAPYFKTQTAQMDNLLSTDFITPNSIKNATYLNANSATIYNSFKSKLEDKAQTDGLYVVYGLRARNNNNTTTIEGGFVNKNNYAGPLNEAEIFYDERRAERACKARGIRNYQVWDVSMHFNKPGVTTKDFEATEALTTIVARQEKEFIKKAMEMHEVVAMRQKIERYEEILKANNLLPAPPEEKIKTKHKI